MERTCRGGWLRGHRSRRLGLLLPSGDSSRLLGVSLEGRPSGWPCAPVHISLPFLSQVWAEVRAVVGRWDWGQERRKERNRRPHPALESYTDTRRE